MTVAGGVVACLTETSVNPKKVDHVWIDLRAGDDGVLRVALSTSSVKSENAGFDPRVRLGIVTSSWNELPAPGVRRASPFDYAAVEKEYPVRYVCQERPALEQLLLEKANRAVYAQARGELYRRQHAGVHQVHSRRASFAIATDLIGRDGAIQFYFQDPAICQLLLFKYAGQP